MGNNETEIGSKKEVKCCPRCKKPVRARDFMNRIVVGMMDSILEKINCRCGYRGVPIVLSIEDYEKWVKDD